MSSSETPIQRLHRIFADTAEKVVREIYTARGEGHPPPEVIAFTREVSVRDQNPPAHIIECMRRLSDAVLSATFADEFRPKITEALTADRPS